VADVLLAVSFVLAAASLVVRFRRSRGSERQQLKWFAYVGLIAAAGLSLLMAYVVFANEEGKDVASWVDALGVLGWFTALLTILIGLPVATGIAILRHRLYDIDVIIRRTLVYGALTATLAACYVGSVLLLPAGAEPRIGLRHRRVYAGGGGPVSACELEDPGAGGPSLLPTPLRRRPDAGALQRAAARRGRSRRGRQRAARGRRGNRSTRTRLAVVSARRAGAHSRRGIVSTTEGPVLTARRFVWGAWALCVSIALPTLVFLALGLGETTPADEFGLTGAGGLAFLVAALAFATTGALVATRVPSNRIGWIFCLIGFVMTAGNLPYQYADDALYLAPGSLPGGVTAAVLQNLGLPSAFGLLGLSLLLFPDGRLLSRRWRPAAGAGLIGSAALAVGYALRPGKLDEPFERIVNPFGVASVELMEELVGLGWILSVVSVALGAVATIVRLRRSRGHERQQLKWIGLAGAVVGLVLVVNLITFPLEVHGVDQLRLVIVGLAFTGFPVAAGVAILRYRLYDIDVVIRRTLIYGALTATLAGAYVGSVLLLQVVLSPDSDFAIAGSTLAVAALFRPASSRIQALVDHRFYRRKYDAAQTIEAFGVRLRDEVELDALSAELGGVVRETMQPAHVSLWLKAPEASR
jgi:hypothetical protein